MDAKAIRPGYDGGLRFWLHRKPEQGPPYDLSSAERAD